VGADVSVSGRRDERRATMRVIALIDGEHHPAVTRDSLARLALENEICGVLFVGGREKVAAGVLDDPRRHFGFDVVLAEDDPPAALRRIAAGAGASAVVELSGEPVLDGDRRLELAAAALGSGLEYRAAGFRVTPPRFEQLDTDVPLLALIGTGKRSGKTAIAGHFARLLVDRGIEPVVVSMGRGGPREPMLVRAAERTDRARLLEIARAGGHAASDYLEDAVLAGVTTIGCRRCGEGPAGEVFDSNVVEGARLALTLEPDAIVLEGSGAAFPPVAAQRTVCVVRASTASVDALSHLGPCRLMRSDLVLLVGADELPPSELDDLKVALGRWCGTAPVIGCRLEFEPAEQLEGDARIALFTTARSGSEQRIRAAFAQSGIELAAFSANLANREALERDIEKAARQRCNLFLTELKAAAVEVVAEAAEGAGTRLVFVRNRPVPLSGEASLDGELVALYEGARSDHPARPPAGSRS
jgi:cyclic 2,3-diphosphoglycerate synthase